MGRIAKILDFTRVVINGLSVGSCRIDAGTEIKETPVFQPSGIDGAPLENDFTATVSTAATGGEAIVGFADNITGEAQPGEARIYARNSSGAVVCSVFLKNTGEITIQGSGDININGVAISATGDIETLGSIKGLGITDTATNVTLNTHNHPDDGAPPTPGS